MLLNGRKTKVRPGDFLIFIFVSNTILLSIIRRRSNFTTIDSLLFSDRDDQMIIGYGAENFSNLAKQTTKAIAETSGLKWEPSGRPTETKIQYMLKK